MATYIVTFKPHVGRPNEVIQADDVNFEPDVDEFTGFIRFSREFSRSNRRDDYDSNTEIVAMFNKADVLFIRLDSSRFQNQVPHVA